MIKKETQGKEIGFRAYCNTRGCDNKGVSAYTSRSGLVEDMTRKNPHTGNWKFEASTSTNNPKAYCPTCNKQQAKKEKT